MTPGLVKSFSNWHSRTGLAPRVLLELVEVLACPRCGPPQGLIVLVDRLAERRVVEGRLDCPNCESRFPIDAGVVSFGMSESEDRVETRAPAANSGHAEPSRAVLLAALLGLHEATGYVLLGPGLEELAEDLADLAARIEFLLLSAAQSASLKGGESFSRVSIVCGTQPGRLPLLNNRLAGAGLASASPELCLAAYATIRTGANLAVLDPLPGTEALLDGAGAQVLAAESRAIAVRRGY